MLVAVHPPRDKIPEDKTCLPGSSRQNKAQIASAPKEAAA